MRRFLDEQIPHLAKKEDNHLVDCMQMEQYRFLLQRRATVESNDKKNYVDKFENENPQARYSCCLMRLLLCYI